MCPPVSPCKGASIVSRCASCVIYKHFNAWKHLLCGWGTCLLRMEKPPLRLRMCPLRMETPPLRVGTCPLWMEAHPLWVGNVLFADGNAAARTFGRAHRRRPYHFSYSSMSQGCRRTVRRWTNIRNVCWRTVCRWTKTKKGCWRGARRRTKQEMYAGEVLADGQT